MTKIESDLHKRMKEARRLEASGRNWQAEKLKRETEALQWVSNDDDD